MLRSRLALSTDLPSGMTIKVADSREELAAAFHILHESYVESGFMMPHDSRMRLNIYQALPTTTTLVAKAGDEVVATMSAVADSAFGMPMDKIYDVTEFRRKNRRLVEISGLAVRKDYRTDHGLILFAMVKYMYHYTEKFMHADRAVISVNPKHENFYHHILLFDKLETTVVESYDFANNAPAVCLTTDLTNYRERFYQEYGHADKSKNLFEYICVDNTKGLVFPEREPFLAYDPVMSPELLDFFFMQKSKTIERLSVHELRAFLNQYRTPDFETVFAKIHGGVRVPDLRQTQRFHVYIPTHSLRSAGSLHFEPNLTILSASAGGVGARIKGPLEASKYQVSFRFGDELLKAYLEPKWQTGFHCGFELLDIGGSWEKLISTLEQAFSRKWAPPGIKQAA